MASPAKKRKNGSQESKLTSTPQKLSSGSQFASPNLSRIGSDTASLVSSKHAAASHLKYFLNNEDKENQAPNENRNPTHSKQIHVSQSTCSQGTHDDTFSTAFTDASSVTLVENDDENDYLDCDTFFKNTPTFKRSGKTWLLYKPISEETVYWVLLNNPQDAEQAAHELILLYDKTQKETIYQLLRFCADVCAYQKWNLKRYYDFRNTDVKGVVKFMESNDSGAEVIKTKKYLLAEPNRVRLVLIIKMAIYNFLQKLILIAHDNEVLYERDFAIFLRFVRAMAGSMTRPVRHTGVVFALKLLTALCMVKHKIIRNENTTRQLTEKHKLIEKYIDYFYITFATNCTILDSRCSLLRVACIRELSVWIQYFPEIFINQLDCIKYLSKVLVDEVRDVRLAALKTCHAIIQTSDFMGFLKGERMERLALNIGNRFYDIDVTVSIKAINLYTSMNKHYSAYITREKFRELLWLIYSQDYRIAKAAADFVLQSSKSSTDDNQEYLLLQLVHLSSKMDINLRPLLVEACIDYEISNLQNWKLIIHIFINDHVSLEKKITLADLTKESVQQSLTGRSSKPRLFSRVADVNESLHLNVAYDFFPIMKHLLYKYNKEPKILKEFFKIVSLVDKNLLVENYLKYYTDIIEIGEKLFDLHDDAELLNAIADTLVQLSTLDNFNAAEVCIEGIMIRYAKGLTDTIQDPAEYPISVAQKSAILFKRFSVVDYIHWNELFPGWDVDHDEVVENLLICCHWYLIWYLRKLVKNGNNINGILSKKIQTLSGYCKEFVSTCFNVLQNLRNQFLQLKVFDILCQFHLDFSEELENPVKSQRAFEVLVPTIKDDEQCQNLLLNFLENQVISNTKIDLYDRKKYVSQFISLILRDILSVGYLSQIFKYYDCYNTEFARIIEGAMKALNESASDMALPLILINTLEMVYDNILTHHNVVDLRSEEAKMLMRLTKRFAAFKLLQNPKQFGLLLLFSTKVAAHSKIHYPFLYFARIFTDLIVGNPNKCEEVLTQLKQNIPKEDQKDDAVLYFSKHLTAQGSGETPIRRKKSLSKAQPKQKENKKPVERTKTKAAVTKKQVTKSTKSKKDIEKKIRRKPTDSETEHSDMMTIHDTSSDDMSELENLTLADSLPKLRM